MYMPEKMIDNNSVMWRLELVTMSGRYGFHDFFFPYVIEHCYIQGSYRFWNPGKVMDMHFMISRARKS